MNETGRATGDAATRRPRELASQVNEIGEAKATRRHADPCELASQVKEIGEARALAHPITCRIDRQGSASVPRRRLSPPNLLHLPDEPAGVGERSPCVALVSPPSLIHLPDELAGVWRKDRIPDDLPIGKRGGTEIRRLRQTGLTGRPRRT